MDGEMDVKTGKSDEKTVLAVVFGGQSSEHEVSRVSAQSVLENVDRTKYEVRMIGITKQGEWLRYDGDLALIGSGEWEAVARKQRHRFSGRKMDEIHTPLRVANASKGSTCSSGSDRITGTSDLNGSDRITGTSDLNGSDRITGTNDLNGSGRTAGTSDLKGTSRTAGSSESNGSYSFNASSCLTLLSNGFSDESESPVEVVFPVLHGPNGEDGSVQGVFQLAGVPYVGCGILASAAGMDKTFSKIVFQQAGIPQARYITVFRNEIDGGMPVIGRRVAEQLGFPCFVKPANAGSSVGVSKVKSHEGLEAALREASKYDSKILVEEFINGREVECAILGNEEPGASVVGEVIPCNEFYDYTAKYLDDRSETRIPADLPPEITEEVQHLAIKAFKSLGGSGLSRVDFFVEHGTNRVILNEINTLPGFTSISMYAKLWAASGIPYPDLVDRLVELALRRHGETGFSIERSASGTDSRLGKEATD